MIRITMLTSEGPREIEVTNPQHCEIIDLIASTYFDCETPEDRVIKDRDIVAAVAIGLIADGDLIGASAYLGKRSRCWEPVIDLIKKVGIEEDLHL